jgi:hypothetical protein
MAAESGPLLVEGAQTAVLLEPRIPDAPSVLDTTELRWFVPGALPTKVSGWFTGSTRSPNERCDTYLLDGRSDVGVKRRFRETLELKVRESLDERIQLGDGLVGSLELWRKWSPAEDFVEVGPDGRWIDVCKSIVKRRFDSDGTEIAFTSGAQPTGAGCDIEIAEVTVGDAQWWTFSFAAFGPVATRRDSLVASWQGLLAVTECPELFAPDTGRAMGYPEWLALTV